jgi:hypothetical protein
VPSLAPRPAENHPGSSQPTKGDPPVETCGHALPRHAALTVAISLDELPVRAGRAQSDARILHPWHLVPSG